MRRLLIFALLLAFAGTVYSDNHGGVDFWVRDLRAKSLTISGSGLRASTGRAATKVVAANNSSSIGIAQADYVCDGTADGVQIQAAIDELVAAGGGSIYFLEGTYIITQSLLVAGNNIGFYGIGNPTIRDTGSSAGLIRFGGTVGSPSDLASNAADMQADVGLAEGEGTNYSADDWILIEDDDDWEYQQVSSISTDILTLARNLTYSYEIADVTCRVTKINFVENIVIEDIVFDGNSGSTMGLSLYKVKDFFLRNVEIKNVIETGDTYAILFRGCYRGNIHGCRNTFGASGVFQLTDWNSDLAFANCYAGGYGHTAYKVHTSRHINFANCNAEGGNGSIRGLIFDASADFCSFVGGSLRGLDSTSTSTAGIVLNSCNYSKIIGTSISDSYGYGIFLSDAHYCHIEDVSVLRSCKKETGGHALIAITGSTYNIIKGSLFDVENAGGSILFDNDCDYNMVVHNDFTWVPVSNISFGTATHNIIKFNRGFVVEASGTTTVASGNTYVDVTHGLDITPSINDIHVTPTNSMGNASKYYISNAGASTFRVNVDVDPGVDTATFVWQVGSH